MQRKFSCCGIFKATDASNDETNNRTKPNCFNWGNDIDAKHTDCNCLPKLFEPKSFDTFGKDSQEISKVSLSNLCTLQNSTINGCNLKNEAQDTFYSQGCFSMLQSQGDDVITMVGIVLGIISACSLLSGVVAGLVYKRAGEYLAVKGSVY